jgi:hypothetical protein
MTIQRFASFFLLAAAVLLLAGAPVFAQATFLEVEGTAYVSGNPEGGTLKCIGGDPLPPGSWPPCTAGSKVQIRKMTLPFNQGFPGAPQFDGQRICIFNAIFDENGKGHAWGTWRMANDDGVVEGIFTSSPTAWHGPNTGKAEGRGTAGNFKGIHVFLLLSYESFPFGTESMTGFVLIPGSVK